MDSLRPAALNGRVVPGTSAVTVSEDGPGLGHSLARGNNCTLIPATAGIRRRRASLNCLTNLKLRVLTADRDRATVAAGAAATPR